MKFRLGLFKLLRVLGDVREACDSLLEGTIALQQFAATLQSAVLNDEPAEISISPQRAERILRLLQPVLRLAEKLAKLVG